MKVRISIIPKLMLLTLPLYAKMKFLYIGIVSIYQIIFLSQKKLTIPKELYFLFLTILYGFFISLTHYNFNVFKSALSWIFLFIMLVVILRKVKNPQSIFTFTLFISVVYSLDALIQFIKGTDIFGIPLCCGIRASGPFSWHSPVIGTFLMTLFFLPEFIVLKKTKKIIIYILFFLGIIVSGCRGALMQILFVLFLFKLNKKQKIFFVLLIIIIVYLLLNYINIDRDAISRLLLIFEPEKMIEYESRSDGRLAFWATYLFTAIKDNILLGAGLGGLESYLSKLTHGHYIHPHHLYLEIVMSLGVVGTFLFILFLFNVYKNTDKKEKFIFWSFWGPFNALHSVFDFYWATMMFFSIMIVLLSKRWRYNRI